MPTKGLIPRILAGVLFAAPFVHAGDRSGALLLTGANVLDAAGGKLLKNHDVLVVGDRIAEVAPSQRIKPPEDVTRLSLTGLTLLPGLIDLHTHLLLRPYDEMSWTDQVLRTSLGTRTIRAVVAARNTLEAGFTTIRDLGTEGAAFADVALRDAVAEELIPGPRILASTRAIVATGCYGPSGFDPRWQVPKGAQEADGVDGVRKVVREQIAAGADWIKVYADYRRRPGHPITPTFSLEELSAIVDEARSAGLPVSAHATTDEAIRRAVLAGVATIEHGSDASNEAFELMRDHQVALCPTLAASEAMAIYAGWNETEPDHPRITKAKEMFARAIRSGVTIACGSDAGVFTHGTNARELELMVAYGMTPVESIRAATITAAEVLGRSDDLGRIAPGYVSDLIALQGDPLEDIANLRNLLVVVVDGKIVIDRRKR